MTVDFQVRSLFRLDAAFEVTLGLALSVGTGLGWLTGSDFPASRALLVVAGVAFLLGGASTLFYFVHSPWRVLRGLALGNGAMAGAGLVWLLADHGFSAAGTSILAGGVAWKFAIAALQLRSIRNWTLAR